MLQSSLLLPEGVAHPVFEADEAFQVFSHQVACVEVSVSLGEDVPHQLLLGQLLASGIAEERAEGAHLGQ